MTTLEAIGFTIAGGSCVLLTTFGLFGLAVSTRSPYVAPRCIARPKDVIYNHTPSNSSQDRGGPMLGWIWWTLGLTYDTMLKGVPGTGTRKGGLEGNMLRVNLDGIVLLRFHAYCLKLTVFASIIYLGIVLPVNISSRCFRVDPEDQVPWCVDSNYTLTNFEKTTLANVPALPRNFEGGSNLVGNTQRNILARLYGIVFCSWLVTFYACRLLKNEWIDILALRRVYFLETDHWGKRKKELEDAPNEEVDEDDDEYENNESSLKGLMHRRAVNRGAPTKDERPPWIPDPNLRDTAPNIELYSILVGGLPALPSEVFDGEDIEAAVGMSRQLSIDWQLAVVTTFFDHCVPNQPGFSSSIAAVTIMPEADRLAQAWRAWYGAASALRRLKFIREVIAERRYYDRSDESDFQNEESAGVHVHPREGQSEYAEPVLSIEDDISTVDENYLFESMKYEPEQSAVYSREMALGAAPCCPFGCREDKVRRAPIDELLEMEKQAAAKVQETTVALQYAQTRALVSLIDSEHPGAKLPKTKDTDEMLKHLEQEARLSTIHSGSLVGSGDDADADKFEPAAATEKKGHRRKRSNFDGIQLPSDMDVEAQLLANIPSSPPRSIIKKVPSTSQSDSAPISVIRTQKRAPSKLQTTFHDTRDDRVDSIIKPRAGTDSSLSEFLGETSLQMEMDEHLPYPVPNKIRTASAGRVTDRFSENESLGDSHFDDRPRIASVGSFTGSVDTLPLSGLFSPAKVGHLNHRKVTPRQENDNPKDRALSEDWENVQRIIAEERTKGTSAKGHYKETYSGVWIVPKLSHLTQWVKSLVLDIKTWAFSKTTDVVDELARESRYAVVTFTSRQAAVAARNCLLDARSSNRWEAETNMPTPPLADAAACDFVTCRGCCRPVTLSINERQKRWRRILATCILAVTYVFYTLPISMASRLVDPEKLHDIIPKSESWDDNAFFSDLLAGLVPALLFTTFFALCPVIFKSVANFGSAATSVANAEFRALQYYWWFMVLTAFTGSSLANMALDAINREGYVQDEIREVLVLMAQSVPTDTSATWINWIIVRTTMTLPLQYMLGINTFIFACLGWKCCTRCVTGGGSGGPVPYRIYIDSGVVLLCVVALSPASPLVCPAALLYFLFMSPLLRRNLIFFYRPKYDAGGKRWPFIFDMSISGLLVGQILLSLMMGLKEAIGPSFFAFVATIPTLVFRAWAREKFLWKYLDAGLLQTSLLDEWDNSVPSNPRRREGFRRFLVDAHKAAYIPVCLAGGATSVLTAEPAVVVHSDNDSEMIYPMNAHDLNSVQDSHFSHVQRGASTRRIMTSSAANAESWRHRSTSPPSHIDAHQTVLPPLNVDDD